MKFPLMRNNLARQDLDAVIEHLKQDDPILTNGPIVRAFEAEWSEWVGTKYSVFVNSGASANLLSMAILKLKHPEGGEIIVPPLTSQYLNLAKNSSLAIAIGYPDLFKVGQTMANQTGQPVPVIILVMATYLAISLVTSLLMNLYNRRIALVER